MLDKELKKLKEGYLRQKQSLPLEAKIIMTKRRIKEWYEYYQGDIYVSFSGGKDSTVLLNIVRELYPNVEAVFCDTGLEFPEIKKFVKSKTNVTIVRPSKNFKEVIREEGYPVISKKVSRMIRDLKNPTDNNVVSRNLYITGIKKDGTETKSFKLPNKYKSLIDAPFKISEKCCDIMKKKTT